MFRFNRNRKIRPVISGLTGDFRAVPVGKLRFFKFRFCRFNRFSLVTRFRVRKSMVRKCKNVYQYQSSTKCQIKNEFASKSKNRRHKVFVTITHIYSVNKNTYIIPAKTDKIFFSCNMKIFLYAFSVALGKTLNCRQRAAGNPFLIKSCLFEKNQRGCSFDYKQCSQTACQFGFALDANKVILEIVFDQNFNKPHFEEIF